MDGFVATGRHDRVEYEAHADIRGVIQHTFVDYRWEIDTEVVHAHGAEAAGGPRGDRRLARARRRRHASDGALSTAIVERAVSGSRVEVRRSTLFVAAEQRVDPYQLEFSTVRWMTAGFRISSLGPSRVP